MSRSKKRRQPTGDRQVTVEDLLYAGQQYFEEGRPEEALAAYAQALEMDRQSSEAHLRFGALLLDTEDFEMGLEHLREAQKLDPADVRPLHLMGEFLMEEGIYDEAEVLFRRALEIEPESSFSYHNLGNLLSEVGEYKEAEENYRKAITLNPNEALHYLGLGGVFADQEQFAEALKHFHHALSLSPDDWRIHHDMADLLVTMGNFQEAVTHYRTALASEADNVAARYGLGNALLLLDNPADAVTELKQAVADGLEAPLAYIKLGIALKLENQIEASRESFQEALNIISEDNQDGELPLEARYELVIAELGSGNTVEAKEAAEQLLAENADPSALGELLADLKFLADQPGAQDVIDILSRQKDFIN